MDLVDKLIKLREARGLSQNSLAKLSGIGQTTLSDIENRKKSPNIITLEKICAALNVTLAEFFADDDLATVAAHRSDGEYGDLPKEAIERIEELKSLYRIKYKLDKDAQK